ncbi:DMT family transporter [Niveibacterium terrae]|uniref:DMT family transporter n=1 Tax=Niveibacterium terrae TaxID=3373598 RepID=UPI003A927BEF
MSLPHELFALAASACWAIGAMLSVSPSRYLGAFAFTRWRMLIVAVALWVGILATRGWQPIALPVAGAMGLSGLIGIFIGDSALFSAMNRLGPRRSGVLFATNAVFSVLLGMLVFDERLNALGALGAVLTFVGVAIAVLLGRSKDESHAWEADRGRVSIGVALGLFAALCQALGTLIAKPAMAGHFDPLTATALRVTAAGAAHFVLLGLGFKVAKAHKPENFAVLFQTGLNGLIAMGLGTSLVMFALQSGDIGIVSILSSVSPVLVLPLLWIHLKRVPAPGAWLGAGLTVVGTACILLR